MKKRTLLKAMALPFAYPATHSLAQIASGRNIRVVVPLPAGTYLDVVARMVMNVVSKDLGQTIIVDNKPGANGVIGTMEVVRAAPDGLTILFATNSHLATAVPLTKNLPYDPRRDVTPIAGGIQGTQMLVVRANSPFRTLADLIAHAKQNPGKVSIGYSTQIVQLEIATLSKMAGIDLLAVPYKGAPQAVTDVIGGVLDATLDNTAQALLQVKAGTTRVLASTAKRSPLFPDVPAVSETLPGFDFPTWNAFVGPAGMPRDVVARLGAAISKAQRQPEIAQKLIEGGSPAFIIEPDALKTYIDSEVTKYVKFVKDAGIQPE